MSGHIYCVSRHPCSDVCPGLSGKYCMIVRTCPEWMSIFRDERGGSERRDDEMEQAREGEGGMHMLFLDMNMSGTLCVDTCGHVGHVEHVH